jgi:hypothetical protein
MPEPTAPERLTEEPPIGSVVAIDWRKHRQEVWVSNSANVGNWYTPDIPIDLRDGHPAWDDVLARAEGRTLTLLVAADKDTYKAGYDAGVSTSIAAVTEAIEDIR